MPSPNRCEVACPAHVLADRRGFALDDAAWTQFNDLLDRPIRHKPRLEKVMAAPSPFAAPRSS